MFSVDVGDFAGGRYESFLLCHLVFMNYYLAVPHGTAYSYE
jgi:hypothetical protein